MTMQIFAFDYNCLMNKSFRENGKSSVKLAFLNEYQETNVENYSWSTYKLLANICTLHVEPE